MRFEDVRHGYRNLWRQMQIRPEHRAAAEAAARRLGAGRAEFQWAADQVGCPWWLVAVVCELEAGGRLDRHLHNGDPLGARTARVPAGRPPAPLEPPFTWRQSALDALRYQKIDRLGPWSLELALFTLEGYNGYGYFGRGVNSPYLWSFTSLYERGKFTSDGHYDAAAVSEQCGAAAILRAMIDLGIAEDPDMDELKQLFSEDPLASIAPTIGGALGGPAGSLLATFAVKALATAFSKPATASPDDVLTAIHGTAPDKLGPLVAKAETALQQLVNTPAPQAPQPAAAPAPVPAPSGFLGVATTIFDRVFAAVGVPPGVKTYLFGALWAAVVAASDMHLAPGLLTPDVASALEVVFAALAGGAVIAKVERYLQLFSLPVPAA